MAVGLILSLAFDLPVRRNLIRERVTCLYKYLFLYFVGFKYFNYNERLHHLLGVTPGRVATRMSGSRDSRPRDHRSRDPVFTEPRLSSSRIPKRWNSTELERVIVGIAIGPGPQPYSLPYLFLTLFLFKEDLFDGGFGYC